jgi:hypothetical protein
MASSNFLNALHANLVQERKLPRESATGALMSRIEGIDPGETRGYVQRVLEAQRNLWGAPLANHLVYARRPDLFRAVRGMWSALDNEGLLGTTLVCLVNRRVAALNGCEF